VLTVAGVPFLVGSEELPLPPAPPPPGPPAPPDPPGPGQGDPYPADPPPPPARVTEAPVIVDAVPGPPAPA